MRVRRHGLLTRLLASSVLVAVCSISATAWLTSQSTSGAIREEQDQTLVTDTRINDTLLGYGATHASWDGVGQTVRDLARKTGRRIALTTESGEPIADSSDTLLPAKPSVVVDPLRVDVTLVPGAAKDRIDPRAVGPFKLAAAERSRLRKAANAGAACARRNGQEADVVLSPSGRPSVEIPSKSTYVVSACALRTLESPTATERKALRQLNHLLNRCLSRQNKSEVTLALDLSWTFKPVAPAPAPSPRVLDQQPVSACLAGARREQLRAYVAPAALLYLGSSAQQPSTELTSAGVARIAGTALLVLLLAITVSFVISTRLTRPVRALTEAAQRMQRGDSSARVAVTATGEVGELSEAFNRMSEHLERMEAQRKAMVSDVSHELRTPLSNLRGWMEAAQDGVAELDPALIDSLVEEIMQLQHIVDDLQELALADAGRLRLHPEPVNVADLLDQIATAHRGRADAAGLALTAETTGAPELLADPVRLRQAVGNLVSNAVHYTPPGGRITLRGRLADGHVLIEVADTGVGIAAEHLPHVFDRFWREEKSRNRRTGGSGLGLAIVRNLAEAHHGTVSVSSVPGEGAVFTLRLPVDPGLPA
ncbi:MULTISPECIES: sensor histidine kinase [Streptosporangium]|uniref:histidine kinase n=1 Tax=Streptosporangium brasiliense TaxID=47480 RepID=A0ABT9R8Q1_9ACTN|nr:ATP-binding protein [Streptosporangium brasiliense]MDP9864790.1 two-component system sensor histidine kinase BaeS [Streptosporangium brasiliense]